ncbi:MAG: hypothetical protein Q7K42_00765 [Candidatus Diapherotrites archaeon]|nr:hypothetical protein [Candidatus Diapherotrites archaeon]
MGKLARKVAHHLPTFSKGIVRPEPGFFKLPKAPSLKRLKGKADVLVAERKEAEKKQILAPSITAFLQEKPELRNLALEAKKAETLAVGKWGKKESQLQVRIAKLGLSWFFPGLRVKFWNWRLQKVQLRKSAAEEVGRKITSFMNAEEARLREEHGFRAVEVTKHIEEIKADYDALRRAVESNLPEYHGQFEKAFKTQLDAFPNRKEGLVRDGAITPADITAYGAKLKAAATLEKIVEARGSWDTVLSYMKNNNYGKAGPAISAFLAAP